MCSLYGVSRDKFSNGLEQVMGVAQKAENTINRQIIKRSIEYAKLKYYSKNLTAPTVLCQNGF